MGGPGSGNYYRWDAHETVEEHRQIDVRRWSRDGLLRANNWFGLTWSSSDGKELASIGVFVRADHVELRYRWKTRNREWEDVEELVRLTTTPCHFGGERVWFFCPGMVSGRVCGRRVAILYTASRYFLCRHCYRLVYRSTREHDYERALNRAQALRRRLGGSGNVYERIPLKPKGMHWRTYRRIYREIDALEERYEVGVMMHLERLLGRSRR